jgi:formyltetrahydrofolate-dependent phosphoribosylglycinamide formyltransferase
MSVPVAVFASGGGSNFQSLLDHASSDTVMRIVLLVSDRPEVGALERAAKAGVATRVIPVKGRPLEEVGTETLAALQEFGVQVILLAGYLRLVPPEVVRAFPRRILNIHPALLPSFGGKGMWGHRVHEAVLASGATLSGPTIHFVDEEYDTGSIFAQWPVPVLPGDTPDTLAARVLQIEHILYPLAAEHLCRAVERGVLVSRPALPGEAFLLSSPFSAPDLRSQIQAAFSPSHKPSHSAPDPSPSRGIP